jgi:hypothetical protein
LFAIGAFLSFTLSQAGMVVHWQRALRDATSASAGRAHRLHFWINTVGAATTAVALIVIIVAKFAEGAWITVLVIPATIALLKAIRGYYDEFAVRVREPKPLELRDRVPPIVLVTTEEWNKLTDKALNLALTLTREVIAVHLTHLAGPEAEESERRLQAQWRIDVEEPVRAAGLVPPPLVILQAEYRTMHEPVLQLVRELERRAGGRRVAVLVPEVVKQRWYEHLLHTHRARHLRSQLVRYGDPHLIVINVPWYLQARPVFDGDQGTQWCRDASKRSH